MLNCPTPLRLNDIPVDQFKPFGKLHLMMGCGLEEEETGSTVPLSDLPGIPGSSELAGASGPVFMAGDLEEATKYLRLNNFDPGGRFQFFRKYKSWSPDGLKGEIRDGLWTVCPQVHERALQVF